MKSSKTLTSAVVAAVLVGGIGLAYAQTQNTSPTMQSAPMQPMDSGAAAVVQPSPAATVAPSADTSFQTERAAQADRN